MPWSLLCLLCTDALRVLRWSEKFFVLQIRDKSDSISVDRLTPVISSVPGVPAVPPLQGRPCLVPASVPRPPDPCQDPASVPRPPDPGHPPVKKVRFSLVPAMLLRWNSHRTVWGYPTSPSGGSILWLLQRRPSSSSGLQTQRELSSNALSWTALSGSRLNLFPFPVTFIFCILACKYIFILSTFVVISWVLKYF